MVWLHGGAYVSGGGEAPKYDAEELAGRGRVVVVRVTYRLGVLGYLKPERRGQSRSSRSDLGAESGCTTTSAHSAATRVG